MALYESSRRQFLVGTTMSLATILSSSLTGCLGHSENSLVCRHQRTAEVFAQFPVAVDTEISLSWIHSIELTRWTDTFLVTKHGLMLSKTAFSSYGAGMPMDEGQLRHENGQVIIEEINRPMEAIRWVHSHDAKYRVAVNGDDQLINAITLPDHELLEITLL